MSSQAGALAIAGTSAPCAGVLCMHGTRAFFARQNKRNARHPPSKNKHRKHTQSLGKLAHNVQRFDVQPSVDANNLVIFVVGQVKVRAYMYHLFKPPPSPHRVGMPGPSISRLRCY